MVSVYDKRPGCEKICLWNTNWTEYTQRNETSICL